MPKRPSPKATLISCPGCIGVLSVVPEEDLSHLHLTCRVGHTYSIQTLLQAKEDQVETTLWSVAALLEHVEIINSMLLKQIGKDQLTIDKQGLKKRIRQVQRQGQYIRQIIGESKTPDLEQCIPQRKR